MGENDVVHERVGGRHVRDTFKYGFTPEIVFHTSRSFVRNDNQTPTRSSGRSSCFYPYSFPRYFTTPINRPLLGIPRMDDYVSFDEFDGNDKTSSV